MKRTRIDRAWRNSNTESSLTQRSKASKGLSHTRVRTGTQTNTTAQVHAPTAAPSRSEARTVQGWSPCATNTSHTPPGGPMCSPHSAHTRSLTVPTTVASCTMGGGRLAGMPHTSSAVQSQSPAVASNRPQLHTHTHTHNTMCTTPGNTHMRSTGHILSWILSGQVKHAKETAAIHAHTQTHSSHTHIRTSVRWWAPSQASHPGRRTACTPRSPSHFHSARNQTTRPVTV